jgi:hypothetical protein
MRYVFFVCERILFCIFTRFIISGLFLNQLKIYYVSLLFRIANKIAQSLPVLGG